MNDTARAAANRTLFAAIVATVGMLFAAFGAAYLERQAARGVWTPVALPSLVWVSTALLAGASVALELVRRRMRGPWLAVAFGCGILFLIAQYGAWQQLRDEGVFLATNPHGSFVYLLSGVHGVHVIGGLIALAVVAAGRLRVGLCAGYWHVLGAVWLYALAVLTLV